MNCKSDTCRAPLNHVEILYSNETDGYCNECLKRLYEEVKGRNLFRIHWFNWFQNYNYYIKKDEKKYIVKMKVLDILATINPKHIMEYYRPFEEGQFIVSKKDWWLANPNLVCNFQNKKIILKIDQYDNADDYLVHSQTIFVKLNFNTQSYMKYCPETNSIIKVKGYWVKDDYKNPKKAIKERILSDRRFECKKRKKTLLKKIDYYKKEQLVGLENVIVENLFY